MKVYISGKITGNKNYKEQFNNAEQKLLKSGVEVFNPVNVSIPVENPTYKDYMKADIQQLINCDCIFMLKNWRTSKGATLEHKIAIALDLIIIYE